MHIDKYEFGLIVIDGHPYRQDLLIWPGHIKSDWWRREGHLLQLEDVTEALDAAPEVLVVGMGFSLRILQTFIMIVNVAHNERIATPLVSHAVFHIDISLKNTGITL